MTREEALATLDGMRTDLVGDVAHLQRKLAMSTFYEDHCGLDGDTSALEEYIGRDIEDKDRQVVAITMALELLELTEGEN